MLARTFATLQNTTLSADFRQGVDAVITEDARNATEAKNLGDTLRGMTSLARLNLPKDHPEFGTIFDGIESREDQRGVRITVKVSQELLGGILDWLNAHARR